MRDLPISYWIRSAYILRRRTEWNVSKSAFVAVFTVTLRKEEACGTTVTRSSASRESCSLQRWAMLVMAELFGAIRALHVPPAYVWRLYDAVGWD